MIQKIDLPTLVIWGKNDSFLLWEPQKDRVIKDLNIAPEDIHIIDAKHFIQEEQPKEINKMILEFLKN